MTRCSLLNIASAAVLITATGTWSQAEILCRNKKGVLAARSTCKSKETQVDPAALGLIGPKGDKGDKGDKADPGPARDGFWSEATVPQPRSRAGSP